MPSCRNSKGSPSYARRTLNPATHSIEGGLRDNASHDLQYCFCSLVMVFKVIRSAAISSYIR